MIKIEHVTKIYQAGKQQHTALKDVSLTVQKGEIFGIVGHSGAGKSTLLRCINFLETPDSGEVWIGDTQLSQLSKKQLQEKRREIGMIFQQFHLLSSKTVFENIAFPMRLSGAGKQKMEQRVRELADLVGITDHLQKYPGELSGGQKQRVGIARALALQPSVLLCDEATSALDPKTTQSILQLLSDINQSLGITIVLITHEMQVIRSICDRVAVIDNGIIVEQGNVNEVFLHPEHQVTKEFLEQVWDETGLSDFPIAEERQVLIRCSFFGDIAYEPILADILPRCKINFSILQGTLSHMKKRPFGRIAILLSGENDDIHAGIRQLQEKGIAVEVIQGCCKI
ncbi:ATP-binding cassette domain-containing protein [Fodinisporobacter ferrooxydans]|uniref:ATP-binding cassette domain-containing protein n=1 Tax=Fodinisporobacter ferrooxydans TaxID=2901836 RepID=A0ABY4CR11_9BACL|nr:ATP-binding cassette domain-containing protein [Alicyclobacillaceae bacterium MYW30-H2]